MRNVMIVGAVVLSFAGRATAQPAPDWKLPKADAQKWVDRVKKVVARDNWTVTVSGNEITVMRDKPAAFVYLAPNSPANAQPMQAGERVVRYVLRFAPRMTTDEYEKLAAVNEASDKEYDRLHAEVKLPHKFDDFIAKTPEEMARVKAFRDAVAKLPRHDLPELYTPEYSIYFFQTGDGGFGAMWIADEGVRAECDHVCKVLVKYFGMYDTHAAAGGKGFGRYLRDLPR
jgi:hypothetical protein